MIENITENMHADGHGGTWWSVIHNMKVYRLRRIEKTYTLFEVDGDSMKISDDTDLAFDIVDEVEDND